MSETISIKKALDKLAGPWPAYTDIGTQVTTNDEFYCDFKSFLMKELRMREPRHLLYYNCGQSFSQRELAIHMKSNNPSFHANESKSADYSDLSMRFIRMDFPPSNFGPCFSVKFKFGEFIDAQESFAEMQKFFLSLSIFFIGFIIQILGLIFPSLKE